MASARLLQPLTAMDAPAIELGAAAPPAAIRCLDRPRLRLIAELALLFVAVPLALWAGMRAHPVMVAVAVALGFTAYLLADPGFDRRRLWNAGDLGRRLRALIAPFLLGALLLTLAVALFAPARLFSLPRQQPLVWALVMLIYPLLSVYPQELIYRSFFFHRYRPLFGDGRTMVAASAIAFSGMHLFLANGLAVSLTLIGGVLFAERYRRTGSLLVTSVEHALYGCLLFTIGLGDFF